VIRPLAALALGALAAGASQVPQGMSRTVLVENASVLVTRLSYEPGTAETSHTHPFSAVVMQLTAGEVDMTIGSEQSRSRREPGMVWFVPANVAHKAVNTGATAFEQIAVGIKPTRPPAADAPPTEAPAGITRTLLLDNAESRVVRVRFTPAAREPVHTHPNDLVTIQISAGEVEILQGTARTSAARAPGFVNFVPRGVPHAYASIDSKPFELMSVAIK